MIKLREIRQARGLTMKELGEAIGVTESAIGLYENGRRKPNYEKLRLIAQVLNCSIDDLVVGETEHASFALALRRLRKERGLSVQQFASDFSSFLGSDVTVSSVRRWESGETKLSESGMRKVAEFFGRPLEEMLAKVEPTDELPEVRMIGRASQKMTPEQRQDMVRVLKIMFPDAFRGEGTT